MNVFKIRDLLKQTIENKTAMLHGIDVSLTSELSTMDRIALSTTSKFLEINLIELKNILDHVEVCCKETTAG